MPDTNIPSNDTEFSQMVKQLLGAATPNPAKFGLTADDVSQIATAHSAFGDAHDAHRQAHEASHAATHAKDAARANLETYVRAAARKINSVPGADNALRVAAGLAPYDGARSPIGAPTSRPLGRLEIGGHFTLVVHFVDETTPQKVAKPHGVQGCQIWSYVGDPAPVDPAGYTFMGLDTRTPYTDTHPAADAGKTVYYWLRWQNAKGEVGPWSDVLSAKIPL